MLLHFAETYFTAEGDREFNVAINGTTVLTNLDIYATVGVNAALVGNRSQPRPTAAAKS